MSPEPPDIRTPFFSLAHVAGFAALLFVLLASPLLMRGKFLPPRDRVYMTEPWGWGAFPYLHDQIFEETNAIDIAFMGPSPMWWGIDTQQVQTELSRGSGRPAVVRSLCWNWCGFDALYFIAKDLVARRRVRMIVFCDLSKGTSDAAHMEAMRWFRFADNATDISGLNWRGKASFYGSAILGAPRNWLSLIRPDGAVMPSDEISWGAFAHVPNPALRLGSLPLKGSLYGPFADFRPSVAPDFSAVVVSPPNKTDEFKFSTRNLYSTQSILAGKIAAFARENKVQLVYLHIPEIYEFGSATIPENADWPQLFDNDLTMVGIPGSKLFAGMSSNEVTKLFWDFQHLNQNGQIFFTSAITPRLVELYESKNQSSFGP